MGEKQECHISFTIERQLKAYTECKDHTERHDILWHEWNHNKRWLMHVQQLIMPSFPSYSMHDATHSEAILHNIEMLLGEENVKLLSATDCFLILHTVYIHDIGMCITHDDKIDIINNTEFHKFIEEVRLTGTSEMSKYAEILLRECSDVESRVEKKEYKKLLQKKLEISYAITYLLAEFRRKEHGDISSKKLKEWIDSPEKLGIGFSAIEIPSRLFYIIANCANTHTKWDFEAVFELHQEDSGFAHDYVHPRFIAILLQLGDALDMDNNRFHPLTKEYLGEIPKTSELHYGKHKAIRRLRITNQKISICADCKDQDELRLVRKECDSIKTILKNISYHWSVIRPKELNIGLPSLDRTELLLKGKRIPEELVESKFEISQDKAFHLLEGNNIYTDENFVFLRELLQNAIDATKLQYFRDCKRQNRRNQNVEIDISLSPDDVKKILSPEQYPVEIEFKVVKKKDDKITEFSKEDYDQLKDGFFDFECGVLVGIRDYGTGISAKDINEIAKVGTSYEKRKAEVEKMPKWLRPTGTFGIGLQSVFLVSKILRAKTYTRKDENYEITFYPRSNEMDGYINVMLTEHKDGDKEEPYCGTRFEVFVPYSKKKLHNESPETWNGTDPFEKGYDNMQMLRHTRELIKQMAFYLGEMVGEPLFPIGLWIIDPCFDVREDFIYNDLFTKKFRETGMTVHINNRDIKEDKSLNRFPVSWAYGLNPEWYIKNDSNGDMYFFDPDKIKLYVWNHECNAYACMGIDRILSMREQINIDESFHHGDGIKIYYKGIKVAEKFFKEDANLIEYIDLKDTLNSRLLKLNRNGFSKEGDEELETVYQKILITVRNALKFYGTTIIDIVEENPNKNGKDKEKIEVQKLFDRVKKGIMESLFSSDEESLNKAEEKLLSIAALIYYAMVSERYELFSTENSNKISKWNTLLSQILNDLNMIDKNSIDKLGNKSTLFSIPIWKFKEYNSYKKESFTVENDNCIFDGQSSSSQKEGYLFENEKVTILDIINVERKFAIFSIRENNSHFWNEYVIDITSCHNVLKNNLEELRCTSSHEKREEIMNEVEKFKESFFDSSIYNYEDDIQKNKVRKIMHIIRWLLSNVPTMAIFSSENGDQRLNILDPEICDTVYFDRNMKYLVFERMIEKYEQKHVSRFSTTVWSGYRYLGLEKNRNSVLHIKRGRMSEIGCCQMIFPINGKNLVQIRDDFDTLKRNVELVSAFKSKLNEMDDYWKYLRINCNSSDITLLNKEYQLLFPLEIEQVKMRVGDNDWESTAMRKINKKICSMLIKINMLEKPDYKRLYNKYVEGEAYNNIVNYVFEHAKMNPLLHQIKILYYNYFCEVYDAFFSMYKNVIITSDIKKILDIFNSEDTES